jgi:hypothetical protein
MAMATMLGINIACGTALVFYTVRIAYLLFPSRLLALGAGAMIAFYPTFVYSVSTYHALNLYILLLLVVFHLCLSVERYTVVNAALAGLLTGMAALARTEYIVLAGAGLLGALLTHRNWRLTAIAASCAILVLLPWTMRNYFVFERFIPVANSAGFNLFKGFNPEANGSGDWVDNHGVAKRLVGQRVSNVAFDKNYESAKDQVFRDAAIAFMKEKPVQSFVVLPIKKVLLFWLFDVYDPIAHKVVYQAAFWPVFLLTLVGLFTAWRSGFLVEPAHRTVLILFAFQTIVMMGYAVHLRYRMNVEPFLFIYAAFGGIVALGALRRKFSNG